MLSTLRHENLKRQLRSDIDPNDVDEYEDDPSPKDPDRPPPRVHFPPNSSSNQTGAPSRKPARTGQSSYETSTEPVVAGQSPSIWSTYNARARRYDEKLLGNWSASMDVLLVFAALFTAIVTTFVNLSIQALQGPDTTAQLLQFMVTQQYPGINESTLPALQTGTPAYAYTVSVLWFASILCALFASTGAMLCKEWCTQYLNREDPTDLKERACGRQYAFDAVIDWHMGTVAVFIPTVLHSSIFLFLIGLWQYLLNVNHSLGVFVGFATVVLLLIYLFLTLLPVFANAPFNTSTTVIVIRLSEIAKNIRIRYLSRIQPPPVYYKLKPWAPRTLTTNPVKRSFSIGTELFVGKIHDTSLAIRLFVHEVVNFNPNQLRHPTLSSWVGITFRSTRVVIDFVLSFKPLMKPLTPKNVIPQNAQLPKRVDARTEVRALLWVFQLPLKMEDVREMLELLYGASVKRPECLVYLLKRVPVLALCMRSVLDDDHITEIERRVATFCMLILGRIRDYYLFELQEAESVVQADEGVERVVKILIPAADDITMLRKLARGGDLKKVAAAMWICPTDAKAQNIVHLIDDHFVAEQELEEAILTQLIRTLHGWIRCCRNTNRSLAVPAFVFWERDGVFVPPSVAVARALLLYLVDFTPVSPLSSFQLKKDVTISTVLVELLQSLDLNLGPEQVQLWRWLCDITCFLWRADPCYVDEWVGVALLKSAQRQQDHGAMILLQVTMTAIAQGPKVLHDNIVQPLTTLANIYNLVMELHPTSDTDLIPPELYSSTIHAYASTLHNAVIRGRQNVSLSDDILESSVGILLHLRMHHSLGRHETVLPSVYSLSIAFHLCPVLIEQVHWEFWSDLLLDISRMIRVDEEAADKVDEEVVDQELDAKMHISLVLDGCSHLMNRRESVCSAINSPKGGTLIELLAEIALVGSSPQRSWKALYLFMMVSRFFTGQIPSLTARISEDFDQRMDSEQPFADPGWRNMQDEFRRCGLDSILESLPESAFFAESVFDWNDGFPLLRLYRRQGQDAGNGTLVEGESGAEDDRLSRVDVHSVVSTEPPSEPLAENKDG